MLLTMYFLIQKHDQTSMTPSHKRSKAAWLHSRQKLPQQWPQLPAWDLCFPVWKNSNASFAFVLRKFSQLTTSLPSERFKSTVLSSRHSHVLVLVPQWGGSLYSVHISHVIITEQQPYKTLTNTKWKSQDRQHSWKHITLLSGNLYYTLYVAAMLPNSHYPFQVRKQPNMKYPSAMGRPWVLQRLWSSWGLWASVFALLYACQAAKI